MSEDNVPQSLRQAVGTAVDPKVDEWWIRDLSKSYSWLRGGETYWVIGGEFGSAVIFQTPDEEYHCLSCPEGWPIISDQLRAAFGSKPWLELGTEVLAQLIAELTRDPRVRLASPEFLERQQPVLDTWLMGDESDPAALADLCTPPDFAEQGDRWELRFNVLDHEGAAERWTVSGLSAPFQIDNVEVNELRPKGTFSYPDEL